MRILSVLAALMMLWSAPLLAQEQSIEGVIGAQLEDFRADDFAAAFGYASPKIRSIFQTPEMFGQMVRDGYPMVHRPRDYRFVGQQERDGARYETVEIEDMQGRIFLLEYAMIETPQGWKIDGVRLVPKNELAV